MQIHVHMKTDLISIHVINDKRIKLRKDSVLYTYTKCKCHKIAGIQIVYILSVQMHIMYMHM